MRQALRGGGGSSGGSSGSVQSQVQTQWNKRSSYVNPPQDSRMNSILKKYGVKLTQGIMQQHDSWLQGASTPQKYPYAVRFLYNPSNIRHSIAVNSDVVPQYQLSPAGAAAVAIGVGSGSIAFRLLFDRTYEIAYGPNSSSPQDLRKVGVYADIAFLERVMGVVSPQTDPLGNQIFQAAQTVPVNFLFGGGYGIAGGVVGLKYVGYINSADITYTQFSENMVPQRCEVDISVTLMVGLDDVASSGGSLLSRGANAPSQIDGRPDNTSRHRQTL